MTMIMESPPSKREALRTSRSERLTANPPEGAQRMSRRVRLEKERAASSRILSDGKAPSTRGLALAKGASARWNARRNSNRNIVEEEYSEELVVEEDMEDAPASASTPRRQRGLPRRTASMDGTSDSQRPLRRPLQRNKSCDGSTMPHQRVLRRNVANHAALDRASSVRRFNGSNRRLLDRAKSERAMDGSSSRRLTMDNSSDDGARGSSRRRHRLDDSTTTNNNRRRQVSSRSMSGSSNGGGSMRRSRKPRGTTDGSGPAMKDHSEDSHSHPVARGKGMDDSSRRRKEPTLSKLSINELRNRLVGATPNTEEVDCGAEGCDDHNNHDSMGSSLGFGNDSFREQPNWEIGNDAGPLTTDLNDDE